MRKLMWFTLGFAVATAVGSYVLALKWYFLAAGICSILLGISLLLMLRIKVMRVAVVVFFAAIIGFCFQIGFDIFYLSTARSADEMQLSMSICASNYSYETDYGNAVIGRVKLNGKSYQVLTYLPEDIQLKPDDSVSGSFTLRSTLPGTSKESRYDRGEGIFLKAYPDGELTKQTADQVTIGAWPAYLRHYITDMVDYLFPGDTESFVRALLLGDTDKIDYATDTDLKMSGIRHIVAVSGLHVSILFSLVAAFVGKRKWLSVLLGIPVLFLFAAITGFSPSIVRACIMHGLMLIAMLFDREYDAPTALSFAVLVMLCCNPWSLTNAGFQLSVGCIAGIALCSGKIQAWLLDKKRLGRFKGKWKGRLSSRISISIGATILTMPLCAHYFGMVSLVSMVTNLLTLWVVGIIFYGILLSCLVALIHAPLGCAIGWLISWPIRYVLWIADAIAKIPFAVVYTNSGYIVAWLILCYVLLAIFLLMKQKRPLILGCCAALSLCMALLVTWTEPLRDECRVTVLDVGQGQCILLQSEGKNFLVDCGGSVDTHAADEAAALLQGQGITSLDGMIITHYDYDHAAGAVHLLTRVGTQRLYLPNCADQDGTAEVLQSYKGGQVQIVSEDLLITFGNVKITLVPSTNRLNDNESGMCVLFQTENCDILITGDRSAAGERELLEHMKLPELEVLIVGHHGSKYSTSRELLLMTKPQYAFISVGDNHYGHPTEEVLERLRAFGCTVYRTDQNSTIVYRG